MSGEAHESTSLELHYGATEPTPPHTLEDGTIRRYLENQRFRRLVETARPFRYDNSHEDTKGHELHVAPDPDPDSITFPGMVELWDRFWNEIPKSEFDVE
nr:DUF6516 family protein [Halolamina sp. CBA1230]